MPLVKPVPFSVLAWGQLTVAVNFSTSKTRTLFLMSIHLGLLLETVLRRPYKTDPKLIIAIITTLLKTQCQVSCSVIHTR